MIKIPVIGAFQMPKIVDTNKLTGLCAHEGGWCSTCNTKTWGVMTGWAGTTAHYKAGCSTCGKGRLYSKKYEITYPLDFQDCMREFMQDIARGVLEENGGTTTQLPPPIELKEIDVCND